MQDIEQATTSSKWHKSGLTRPKTIQSMQFHQDRIRERQPKAEVDDADIGGQTGSGCEIRVTGNQVVMTGSNAALAAAIAETKKGTSCEVPKSVLGWLPDLGSNQGPTD